MEKKLSTELRKKFIKQQLVSFVYMGHLKLCNHFFHFISYWQNFHNNRDIQKILKTLNFHKQFTMTKDLFFTYFTSKRREFLRSE